MQTFSLITYAKSHKIYIRFKLYHEARGKGNCIYQSVKSFWIIRHFNKMLSFTSELKVNFTDRYLRPYTCFGTARHLLVNRNNWCDTWQECVMYVSWKSICKSPIYSLVNVWWLVDVWDENGKLDGVRAAGTDIIGRDFTRLCCVVLLTNRGKRGGDRCTWWISHTSPFLSSIFNANKFFKHAQQIKFNLSFYFSLDS